MIQVRDYVLIFEPIWSLTERAYVRVCKIDKLDSRKPTHTTLPDHDRYSCDFAVACFNGEKVFLIGGHDRSYIKQKAVSSYDIQQQKWYDAPDLQEARAKSSSLCLDGTIYVFGGEDMFGDEGIKTIESLKVDVDQQWSIIGKHELVDRFATASTAISKNTIAVFGGNKRGGYLFNVATKEIKPMDGELDIEFYSCQEAHQVSKQRFIAVGIIDFDDSHVKKIELFMNKSATYFKTRFIADYDNP